MSVKSEDFFAVFSVSLASNPMLCTLHPYGFLLANLCFVTCILVVCGLQSCCFRPANTLPMSCLAHYQCLTMYFSNVSTCTIVLSLLQLLLAEPPVDELAGDAHFLRDVR